ncbi:hypothetical protein CVT25_005575 [Psilocybe cyanescens]|uniref:Uncharacterized protein n=1 Tax=Psilocybe cyanescens TaxID=93625 RepID=A0A409X666_PSICY|nr:hypothetical protein CVT25_005575 [Psilocybe cyanescens]
MAQTYNKGLSPISLRIAKLNESTASSQSKAPEKSPARQIGKHVLRYTIFALVSVATIYGGAHLYVEHVQMAPETDHEVKKWEWDLINNNWTGEPVKGGTSPALGFRARHIIRAAFASYNHNAPDTTVMVEETTPGGNSSNNQTKAIHVVDARLYETERHLRNAILLIKEKLSKNGLGSHAFAMLLLRHAGILEQLGHDVHISLAKEEYECAWQYCTTPQYQEFIAWKLGDLNSRLGHNNEAIQWWNKSIQLIQESSQGSVDVSTGNQLIPHSPLAQRILASILVSKSSHLAASGNFEEAQALEESALHFLRSIRHPDSISATSSPQALHALYLLQRSSLLSIHQAEVLHAQRRPLNTSIQWLSSAAESSERVVQILTGTKSDSPSTSDRSNPSIYSKNIAELLPVYTDSSSMNTPARALLRDARRTAAEAWNMMGILHEKRDGTGSRPALECFERAVIWAGTVEGKNQSVGPAKDTLHSDWHIYWSNYQRAKNIQASNPNDAPE